MYSIDLELTKGRYVFACIGFSCDEEWSASQMSMPFEEVLQRHIHVCSNLILIVRYSSSTCENRIQNHSILEIMNSHRERQLHMTDVVKALADSAS